MAAYKHPVKKDQMEVIIRTMVEKIEGSIHKFPDARLLDMLNKTQGSFIPISDARVYDLETGKLLFESDFLALNRDQIVLIAESYHIPGN